MRRDTQPAVIAVAGATRFAAGVLMGTGMAVYTGDVSSEFAVSAVVTAFFLGTMLFSPVWGAIADVTGRRRAVLIGTGVLATLSVLPLSVVGKAGPTVATPIGRVGGVWVPIGLRALYAAFAAGFPPVMLTVVSERGGATGRGRSLGFFNSARAVGFAGGQLVVGALLGVLLPSSLYLVIAGVSLVSTLAVAFVVDPAPDPPGDPSLGDVASEVRHRLLPAVEDRGHLRTNGLRWLYVALALRNMTVLGTTSLLPVYLTNAEAMGGLGVTEFTMGAILALNPAGQAVAMYLFGRVADANGRKPLVVVGMAGSGAFALVAAAASTPGTVLAGVTVPGGDLAQIGLAGLALVVLAASFSAMTTGALAFIGDVAPADRESELMGLRSTAKGVGGVFGPPLFGAVATVTTTGTTFALGSTLAFAAAALVGVGLSESRPAASGPDVGSAVDGHD